jgi:hypothetical protein
MGILETFSKRQKQLAKAGKQDVYRYDELPEPFRIQVVHIWRTALGVYFQGHGYSSSASSPSNKYWKAIHDNLARELGLFQLGDNRSDPDQQCRQYLSRASVPGALDIIELSFRTIDRLVRSMHHYDLQAAQITQHPDDAIGELNARFLEHGLGYQYVNGMIVRLDSQFVHGEVVMPALSLLNEAGFAGPNDEFMRALDHHRKGNNKEAIAEALKALESTMKSICAERKWTHPPNATAKPLLDILFQNGLVPPEMESHFAGLRSAMESGLPTLANRTSRHGQGAIPVEVPAHFAAYALHLLASNIVFLVECHKKKK